MANTVNSSLNSTEVRPLRERILKLVIIGKPRVGKTSLRRVFMGKNFRQNYLPTLGADFSLYVMDYKKQRLKTTLWDLSGQTRFSKVHPQYYVGSHGAIVLYDINSENPEEELIAWVDKYIEHTGRYTGPLLILQNKIDLIETHDETKMSMRHDKIIRNLEIYYENRVKIYSGRTSAKTGENVSEYLEQFIKNIADIQRDRSLVGDNFGINDNDIEYTEGAYIITFDNLIGPVIVTKSPKSPHMDYSNQEEMSMVKLSASIDLEDLVENKYETGTAGWTDPESVFFYLSFVIENENARGGHDLYIIGVNVAKDLRNLVGDKHNLIQGYLINKMNRFSDFLASHNYVLSDEQDLIRLYQSTNDHEKLLQILIDLRQELEGIIKEKLSRQ